MHSTGIEPTPLWFGIFSLTDRASGVLFEVAALRFISLSVHITHCKH
jgi:hypothetical protein